MSHVMIRNMNVDDYIVLKEMINAIHELHANHRRDIFNKTDEVFSEKEFVKLLNDENKVSFIAQINGEVVGICLMTFKEVGDGDAFVKRKIAYIDDLGVSKKFRHQGIGTLLFEHAKKVAKDQLSDSLELMVWEFNEDALRFYEAINMHTRSRVLEIKI